MKLLKMELDNILAQCSICNKIMHNNEWIAYEKVRELYKDYRKSHGYCSVECFAKGSNISIDEAQAYWKQVEGDNNGPD